MKTGQGIFRDHVNTAALAPPAGVTLSVLDLGTTYADEFDSEGGIYHYPRTRRPGRDQAEVEATKNAGRLALPLFVILPGETATTRAVRRAFVASWNDEVGWFLLTFAPEHPAPKAVKHDPPFVLKVAGRRGTRTRPTQARPGQARFAFSVFERYGTRCAVCDVALKELLEAAHLCPFSEGGTDDPRNGLVLCRNHHRALDAGLLWFDPTTGRAITREGGPGLTALSVSVFQLRAPLPHFAALQWRARSGHQS
jgi:hypothetical protein